MFEFSPRTLSGVRRIAAVMPVLASAAGGYALIVRGALTLDLDLGRRYRGRRRGAGGACQQESAAAQRPHDAAARQSLARKLLPIV